MKKRRFEEAKSEKNEVENFAGADAAWGNGAASALFLDMEKS